MIYSLHIVHWLSSLEMDMAPGVQILDETVFISHSANNIGKVQIQLFSLQLWVNSRARWLFNLCMATYLKEKLWI